MKLLNTKTPFLFLLITLFFTNIILAQTDSGDLISSIEVSYNHPDNSKKFKANISSVVINHEEQYSYFKDLKKAIKKSKSLTLISSDRIPSEAFTKGFTYEIIWLKINGKTLKLQNAIVENKSQKGKKTHIALKYKSAK